MPERAAWITRPPRLSEHIQFLGLARKNNLFCLKEKLDKRKAQRWRAGLIVSAREFAYPFIAEFSREIINRDSDFVREEIFIAGVSLGRHELTIAGNCERDKMGSEENWKSGKTKAGIRIIGEIRKIKN